jgi:hypothetical protein
MKGCQYQPEHWVPKWPDHTDPVVWKATPSFRGYICSSCLTHTEIGNGEIVGLISISMFTEEYVVFFPRFIYLNSEK